MCLKRQHNVQYVKRELQEIECGTGEKSLYNVQRFLFLQWTSEEHNTSSFSTCYSNFDDALCACGLVRAYTLYDLENSLLDGKIESFICHNFNVDLSPISRFFFSIFRCQIRFYLEIVLFSCGKKGHSKKKNKQVFYSNTNLLGFGPGRNAANRFFYLSAC